MKVLDAKKWKFQALRTKIVSHANKQKKPKFSGNFISLANENNCNLWNQLKRRMRIL